MTFYGEATDDAPTFTVANNDISNRTKTSHFATWFNVPTWETDQTYNTPDLSSIIQEIDDRGGRTSGQDLAFLIESEGLRQAYSRDENAAKAPSLSITYTIPTSIFYVMEIDINSISFFDSVTTLNNVQNVTFNLCYLI